MHNSPLSCKHLLLMILSLLLFSCVSSESDSSDQIIDQPLGEKLQLVISWYDNSDNESGYIVERRLAGEDAYDQAIFLPQDSDRYDDKTAFTGQTYCYQVSAYNQAGKSASDEVCIAI
ncbi:fibronectin type III domain-containing protein [Psychromonas sp. MME2]|uniref:fibronectin type III domain-containing protein n=1 Tax=unclassified Psychromonas TaxID=2614957 RepID=UPI00339C74A6